MGRFLVAALFLSIGAVGAQDSEDTWRIHEWGTFTSLQDEAGRALGSINTEDEPVPPFVHRLSKSLLIPIDDVPPVMTKDAPNSHPDVTLRLETPVVYFHAPRSAKPPVTIDLKVDFRGGWLTEYYPHAKVTAPGANRRDLQNGRIRANTVGSLEWKNLKVGELRPYPETKESVWLSPRDVVASSLVAANGEAERFLFYRGVANAEAPIKVARSDDSRMLLVKGNLPVPLTSRAPYKVPQAWLADIRENGQTAWRPVKPFSIPGNFIDVAARIPATFEERDYSAARMKDLRDDMRRGLILDGLHADEADALLNTWEVSYFKSAGTRLFFLVPRAWTDHIIPLKTSLPAEITRVMVGRIELITPKDRERLRRIVTGRDCSTAWYSDWLKKCPEAAARHLRRRAEGNLTSLRDETVPIPDNYLAYLEMGRFRNALVLDELNRRPGEAIQEFVDTYGLHAAPLPEHDE